MSTRQDLRQRSELFLHARALKRRLSGSGLGGHLAGIVLARPRWGRSIAFKSLGHDALYRSLEESRRFCRDRPLGKALHRQGMSFREIHARPGLHLSLEPGELVRVHLDRSAPAVGIDPDGTCLYAGRQAALHLWLDVLPSLARRSTRHSGYRGAGSCSTPGQMLTTGRVMPRTSSGSDTVGGSGEPGLESQWFDPSGVRALMRGRAPPPSLRLVTVLPTKRWSSQWVG